MTSTNSKGPLRSLQVEFLDKDSPAEWRSEFNNEKLFEYPHHKVESNFDRMLSFIRGMTARRRSVNLAYDYYAAPMEDGLESPPTSPIMSQRRTTKSSHVLRLLKRSIKVLPLAILLAFGFVHVLLVLLGRIRLLWSLEPYTIYLPDWGKSNHVGDGLSQYPTDATQDILPIPCHSHNDYWRRVPLFDAIRAGCTSVEADVWLFEDEDDLFVGHNTASLTRNRTLASLYVNPLVELIGSMNPTTEFAQTVSNGVFDEDPAQTLVLLVDFKTNGRALFPHVLKQLEPLRKKNYLSYWDDKHEKFISRAVTVVGTGNTPFDLVTEYQHHRDIFFDAPLAEMAVPLHRASDQNNEDNKSHAGPAARRSSSRVKARGQGRTGTGAVPSPDAFNISNSYYASVSFAKSIGFPWRGQLSNNQLEMIREQIKGAKRKGLKTRYWDTPSWPTSLRNEIWQVLTQEGAEVLNVDDLDAASRLDWTKPVRHDWFDA